MYENRLNFEKKENSLITQLVFVTLTITNMRIEKKTLNISLAHQSKQVNYSKYE